jgi:DNA-directed RNA polymerase subunit M/transcription elongation factor TFIIS
MTTIEMTTIMDFRIKGKIALSKVLNEEKNIDVLEKYVYNVSVEKNIDDIQNTYTLFLYQTIGDIMNEKKLKDILSQIKKKKLGWDHECYKEISNSIDEQNEFIQNPFEVAEGVFQCRNCGSKRVYSYTRQDRSCDEGTSVYCQCVACRINWRERG